MVVIYKYPFLNSNSVTDIFSSLFSFVFRSLPCFVLVAFVWCCDYFILCMCVLRYVLLSVCLSVRVWNQIAACPHQHPEKKYLKLWLNLQNPSHFMDFEESRILQSIPIKHPEFHAQHARKSIQTPWIISLTPLQHSWKFFTPACHWEKQYTLIFL